MQTAVSKIEMASGPEDSVYDAIRDALRKANHYECLVECDHRGTWFEVTPSTTQRAASLQWHDRAGLLRLKHLQSGEQFRRVCGGHEGEQVWQLVECDLDFVALNFDGGVQARQFDRDQKVRLVEVEE